VRAAKCRRFSAHGFPGIFVHDSARESQKLPVGAVRKKINGSAVYIRAKCYSSFHIVQCRAFNIIDEN
jgi:hypothetical protein